jgi:hypothetical protein
VDEKANIRRGIIGRVMLRGVVDWKEFFRRAPLEIQVLPEIAREEVLLGIMSLSGKGEDVLKDDEFLFGLADLENVNLESR